MKTGAETKKRRTRNQKWDKGLKKKDKKMEKNVFPLSEGLGRERPS